MGDGRANLLGTRQGRHALVGSFFASIALPISAVITGPIFARTIAATGRGEATTVTAPLILGVGLVSGGLYSATVYYVSRRAEHAAVVVRNGAKLAIGTGVVLTLIIIAIAPALARQSPELVEPIRWCALVLP
ncbi:MAG: O-antigen/teichoic acid export membrane protein, partial [Myxococcota bacterium]